MTSSSEDEAPADEIQRQTQRGQRGGLGKEKSAHQVSQSTTGNKRMNSISKESVALLDEDEDGEEETIARASISALPATTDPTNDASTMGSTAAVRESISSLVQRAAGGNVSSRLASVTAHPWERFVRSGTHLQSLLSDALTEVQTTFALRKKQTESNKRDRDESAEESDDEMSPSAATRPRVTTVADFSAELAREKTALVMQLQRQLKDAQVQSDVMKAANASLREETASSQSRLERTMEALRIAGRNASKARADADAAEATAANLAQTLQSLQTVIAETKHASQILHQEQQAVSAKASQVEAKLLLKEVDLARVQKNLTTMRQNYSVLETANQSSVDKRAFLEREVQKRQLELSEAKRAAEEQNALVQARKERADKVAQELHSAQTLLIKATEGQAAAEKTQIVLKETILTLQQANKDLHDTLEEQQTASRHDQQRLIENVAKLESETQRLRIAAEASAEEIQRLKLDKSTADRQIQELNTQLRKAVDQNRKAEKSVAVTASAVVSPAEVTSPSTQSAQLSFHLPPLASGTKATASKVYGSVTDKENEGVEKGLLCCICFKASIGMMKTCQCGSNKCFKKAHLTCLKTITPGPSVSHPGTPAPKLPVVLCGSVRARMTLAATSSRNGSN